jgi:hypothetical protein
MKNAKQQDRMDHYKVTKPAEEEWDQTGTRLAKYDQNSERTSGWNYQANIIRWGDSGNSNSKLDFVWVGSDIVQVRSDIVRLEVSGNMICSQNSPLSSQTWFLSYTAPNRMKFGHKCHLNKRSKFPKVVFPKYKDFPSDFGWTQKP